MADFDAKPAATGAQAPAAPRVGMLIRAAKLIYGGGEYLCVMRDVSSGEIKLRLFHPLPVGDEPFELELANGDRHAMVRLWERDGHAGFRFLERVSVAELVNENGPFGKRPLRLRMKLPATITINGDEYPALVLDLSQQGARIETPAYLALDQQIRVAIQGLPEIWAKVRWRNLPAVGLVFETTFKLDELARLTAALQASPDGQAARYG